MVCPRCDEGILKKIEFNKDQRIGFLCDVCGVAWHEDEEISAYTGHVIEELLEDDDKGYIFIDIDAKDEKNKSVLYPKYK